MSSWQDLERYLPTAPDDWTPEQRATVEAYAQLFAALWEVRARAPQRKPRLVSVRCEVDRCGAEIGTVTSSHLGPYFRSVIRAQPWDRALKPNDRIRTRLMPVLDDHDDLLTILHEHLGGVLYETFVSGEPELQAHLTDEVCEDLLGFPPDEPGWHPPLLVRCRRHPEVKTLSRDQVIAAVRAARTRAPQTLWV